MPAYAFLYGVPLRTLREARRAPLRLSRHFSSLRRLPRSSCSADRTNCAWSAATWVMAPRSAPSITDARSIQRWASPRRGPGHGNSLRRYRPGVIAFSSGRKALREQWRDPRQERACSAYPAFRVTCAKSSRPPMKVTTRTTCPQGLLLPCAKIHRRLCRRDGRSGCRIFTGGIGQGSAEVRALALQGLECMGIKLDSKRNTEARGFEEVCRISADDSNPAVLVVPADEERMMAREALRTLCRSYITRVLETQKQRPFLGRGLGASHSSDTGTCRGAVWKGPSTHQACRSFAARPVCLQGAARHRRTEGPH